MIRTLPFATVSFLGLVAFLSAPVLGDQPRSAGKSAAIFEVRLPAGAVLAIDGYPTRSTGETRRFQSPPLDVGKNYPYTLKATWQGKEALKEIRVKADEVTSVEFKGEDFQFPAPAEVKPAPAPVAKEDKSPLKKAPPTRDGFVLKEVDGRWWVFTADSKELGEFTKHGDLEKHVSRINAAPYGVTMKAPDIATLEDYLTAKPGFVTKYEDGRLWIFKAGSKELEAFKKHGDLEKHVVRPGAGPRRMTVKAPDAETIDAYLKAALD